MPFTFKCFIRDFSPRKEWMKLIRALIEEVTFSALKYFYRTRFESNELKQGCLILEGLTTLHGFWLPFIQVHLSWNRDYNAYVFSVRKIITLYEKGMLYV